MCRSESADSHPKLLRSSAAVDYLIPLLLYVPLAAASAYLLREQINPDGAYYIHLATYIAGGRPWMAVSGYWSPLFIFLLAPFLKANIDGLYAARIVLGLAGGGVVLASVFLLRRCTRLGPAWRMAVASAVAVNAVGWATNIITPDMILAAILLVYVSLTYSAALVHRRGLQLACGALGGLAYLAKSYGLPFFLAHFTLAVVFHGLTTKAPRAQVIKALACGFVAFLAVAGPWIAILSYKYQKPTFSTAGPINWAIAGPPDVYRLHSDALRVPAPGRLFLGEDLDAQHYEPWSPLQSKAYFLYQVKKILLTAERIVDTVRFYDVLGAILPIILFLPLLLMAYGACDRLQLAWFTGTMAIYCSGFLFVWYDGRYLTGFVLVLCLALGAELLAQLMHILAAATPGSVGRGRRIWLGIAAALLFCSVCYYPLSKMAANRAFHGALGPWREIAAQLNADGLAGPMAVCKGSYSSAALPISYHLGIPLYGEALAPKVGDPISQGLQPQKVSDIEAELAKFDVKLFVVETKWPQCKEFMAQTKWVLKRSYQGAKGMIHIYAPPRKQQI
jgi:hypothetical protein